MNVVSLFDGISVLRNALNNLGIVPDNYIGVEIDKYPKIISKSNWPDIIQLDDVTEISGRDFPFKVDLLVAGSPCQGFSLQGLQQGLNDPRSGLIQHFFRVLEETKPSYFLLENVRMKPEVRDYISNRLGTKPLEINSSLLVPQSRNRLYWTNIPSIAPNQINYNVLDLCPEGFVPGTTRKGPPRKVVTTDIFGCITATYYKGIRADGRPLLCKETGEFDSVRDKLLMLSPELCETLQGLPTGYTDYVSNTQRYKSIGNAFTSNVIEHILKGMI